MGEIQNGLNFKGLGPQYKRAKKMEDYDNMYHEVRPMFEPQGKGTNGNTALMGYLHLLIS